MLRLRQNHGFKTMMEDGYCRCYGSGQIYQFYVWPSNSDVGRPAGSGEALPIAEHSRDTELSGLRRSPWCQSHEWGDDRFFDNRMELTWWERQIDNVGDGRSKDRITYFQKPGSELDCLLTKTVEQNLRKFGFRCRSVGGDSQCGMK